MDIHIHWVMSALLKCSNSILPKRHTLLKCGNLHQHPKKDLASLWLLEKKKSKKLLTIRRYSILKWSLLKSSLGHYWTAMRMRGRWKGRRVLNANSYLLREILSITMFPYSPPHPDISATKSPTSYIKVFVSKETKPLTSMEFNEHKKGTMPYNLHLEINVTSCQNHYTEIILWNFKLYFSPFSKDVNKYFYGNRMTTNKPKLLPHVR